MKIFKDIYIPSIIYKNEYFYLRRGHIWGSIFRAPFCRIYIYRCFRAPKSVKNEFCTCICVGST